MNNFLLDIDEKGVAVLTANRPEVMNAMNDECWKELREFFPWADKEDSIKIIIITGAGEKSFIAGADINALKSKKSVDALNGGAQKACDAIQKCIKPIIAAVNGYAFGGGCEIAISCDFRVCSDKATFGLPETGLGILPAAGGTQRLAKIVGMGRAMDMIMLGRNFKGEEAAQIGLATRCVAPEELLDEARKMADKLMAKGPVALRVVKRVIHASMETSMEIGQLLELYGMAILCGTEDKTEGVTAFLEKRTPEYKGK